MNDTSQADQLQALLGLQWPPIAVAFQASAPADLPQVEAEAPFDADVVLVRGNAKQMMFIAEAAGAVGLSGGSALMGRPTCAMIPAAMQGGYVTTSLGCIGNRVYTGLGDDEFYAAIPGSKL